MDSNADDTRHRVIPLGETRATFPPEPTRLTSHAGSSPAVRTTNWQIHVEFVEAELSATPLCLLLVWISLRSSLSTITHYLPLGRMPVGALKATRRHA